MKYIHSNHLVNKEIEMNHEFPIVIQLQIHRKSGPKMVQTLVWVKLLKLVQITTFFLKSLHKRHNLNRLSNVQLVLVDHHVLQTQDMSLLPRIVEIIDHREQSPLAKFPPDCQITRELVGSCSSLIADVLA